MKPTFYFINFKKVDKYKFIRLVNSIKLLLLSIVNKYYTIDKRFLLQEFKLCKCL